MTKSKKVTIKIDLDVDVINALVEIAKLADTDINTVICVYLATFIYQHKDVKPKKGKKSG